jgi:hypothetical protein
MADPCAPLAPCNDLDGKLLVQRSVYGPQLAFDPGTVSLAGLSTRGAALRGVLDLLFEVRWRSTGLCQGPATSVMGLAPGEVVTVGLRTRSTRSFSSLIRDAAESSRSSSRTERDTGPAGGTTGGGVNIGGIIGGIVSAIGQQAGDSQAGRFVDKLAERVGTQVEQSAKQAAGLAAKAGEYAIDLVPIFVGKFGSLLGDALGALGAGIGAVAGGVAGVAGAVAGVGAAAGNAVSDLVDNVVGGAAGGAAAAGIVGTIQQIHEVVDTVERSESESHLRETSVTTTTESEQTIQRTFGNPYLDRSLELRFMPVFHRYEVTVVPTLGRAGLATVVADPDPAERPSPAAPGFASRLGNLSVAVAGRAAAVAPRVRTAFSASVNVGDEDALRVPMLTLLQRATGPEDARRSVRLDQGLAWERTDARGSAVHVPLADADVVRKAWSLQGRAAERLQDALGRLAPDRLGRLFPQPNVRVVHVFAGVHVEAVPGSCVLPDIPEHLRVTVPGGTQYFPAAQAKA